MHNEEEFCTLYAAIPALENPTNLFHDFPFNNPTIC